MQDPTASELLDCLCADALAHAAAFRFDGPDGALEDVELHATGIDGQRYVVRGETELDAVAELARLLGYELEDA